MKIIGLDAGSVSIKTAVLDSAGTILGRDYRKHGGHPVPLALEMLRAAAGAGECTIATTGSAARLLAPLLGVEPVNEIVAHSYATRLLHPGIRTIIEMGGEDSKLILLGAKGVEDFAMNSVCAAGTGSFLDQQAERLRLSLEEFGRMALGPKSPPRIAGRCSVFAKSDMIHLQQIATPVEEIVAGLCFAVARNFRGSIARGRSIVAPVAFQGGVAANPGMVRAFREVLGLDELFVPPDFAVLGAIGAALKARDAGRLVPLRRQVIESHLRAAAPAAAGHPPLLAPGDGFAERHLQDERCVVHPPAKGAPPVRVYVGVDVGSISTNVAVLDACGRLLSKRYLMTAGRPIDAVRQGLRETAAELADAIEIAGVGTTGSGRYMIADFIGADVVKNEITAQATAAAAIDPTVDTIFEIGGQDSKFIALEAGVIVDFEMNKACAAGTGSFLEEQAEKLGISVRREFAECAFAGDCPTKLGERCTVFMENSLMASLQRGADKNDLFAGLAYSIVQNYLNRVVAGRTIGRNIFFQGGVAFNKAVVAAFEKHLGTTITVPPNHDVTGAIGMALIARRQMLAADGRPTAFKGFERVGRPYGISSFGCKGCENLCEINSVSVAGESRRLFYGGRCEKYDVGLKPPAGIPDLFAARDELLGKAMAEHRARAAAGGRPPRGRIGIPSVFFFNEQLPFWATLLDRLGFAIEVSPRPNRQIVDLGLESVLSETCFPVKVGIGHLRFLAGLRLDAIFLPSFVNVNTREDECGLGAACPHTQSFPYVGRVAVPGVEILAPVVDLAWDRERLGREVRRSLRRFDVGRREIGSALRCAEQAQAAFTAGLRRLGAEALAGLKGRAIVIAGRSYNALDRGMNLRIPEKLATLGVTAIPMDLLPLDDVRIAPSWPGMYWRSGQRLLRAARLIANDERLFPIVIGNFCCGPDSFILKYFKEELRGKPFLHLEIDEHSADAGAVTRCEAFLDSIGSRVAAPAAAPAPAMPAARQRPRTRLKNRTVYIPPMSDHSAAVASAFERCGFDAEVLPPSDRATVETGMRHLSGKECYPCVVTTGDMLKKAASSGFDPARSAFFMPSGSGPCRFGQYNVVHRWILDSVGLADVPVFAPNQDVGFSESLGAVGGDFALQAWRGIVAIELLVKSLHASRPYERRPGVSDELYRHHLGRVVTSLRSRNGALETALGVAGRDFAELPRDGGRKPLIGVIGEIFVRSNVFSNEDLVRSIEALGGEVRLAPVGEWVSYANLLELRHAVARRQWRSAFAALATRAVQKRVEHRLTKRFAGSLRLAAEPSTSRVMREAAPYLHESFEGEAILSIGKAVDLARTGAHGVVNAMPFGCMPGTIVTALMRAVSRDHGLPCISVAYDGTAAATNDIQLTAFMDQARERVACSSPAR